VEVVLQWERPKTVTEIRSFVALAGYFRRLTIYFSRIVTPLTQLTHKDQPFAGPIGGSKVCGVEEKVD